MKKIIRKLVPNSVVNYGKHLPTAVMANIKYGFPSRGIKVIGVTGTDGKTTTCNMIFKILKDAGKKVSLISTINAQIGDKKYDTGFHVTSPTHFDMQKYIYQAKKAGSEFLVLEITSFALAQYRAWGVKFEIGVVTNITNNEHLDYHKTFENYLQAKAKLIKQVKQAVLNKDDSNFSRLAKMTLGKVVSFGSSRAADINPQKFPLKLKIMGDYNILNALASAAVCSELGIPKDRIKQSLEEFDNLEGRMQEVKNNKGIKIYIDFAHTPNALENALQALKENHKSTGKLISIFGSASERDVQKRPVMGEISGRLADITILTDEDPRFEDPLKIINQIAEGVIKSGGQEGVNLYKIPNRQEAIKKGLSLAKGGDVIGIFGKGHEKSMNYKGVEKAWSDIEAVNGLLKT